MNALEKVYLNRALMFKDKYDKTKWWQFGLRAKYKKEWNHALDMMIKYAEPIPRKPINKT